MDVNSLTVTVLCGDALLVCVHVDRFSIHFSIQLSSCYSSTGIILRLQVYRL